MISTYVCLVSLGSVLLCDEGCFTVCGRLVGGFDSRYCTDWRCKRHGAHPDSSTSPRLMSRTTSYPVYDPAAIYKFTVKISHAAV